MSPTKTATKKKSTTKKVEADDHEEELLKVKKIPVLIEDVEVAPIIAEEKLPDDPLLESEEEVDDELGLDDEDINPFGDKWEQ